MSDPTPLNVIVVMSVLLGVPLCIGFYLGRLRAKRHDAPRARPIPWDRFGKPRPENLRKPTELPPPPPVAGGWCPPPKTAPPNPPPVPPPPPAPPAWCVTDYRDEPTPTRKLRPLEFMRADGGY